MQFRLDYINHNKSIYLLNIENTYEQHWLHLNLKKKEEITLSRIAVKTVLSNVFLVMLFFSFLFINMRAKEIKHTHEAGGYLGNGAIDLVATLLGRSCLIPLLRRCFLLSRDLDLSIRAACILASFVAFGTRGQKDQPLATERPLTHWFLYVCTHFLTLDNRLRNVLFTVIFCRDVIF